MMCYDKVKLVSSIVEQVVPLVWSGRGRGNVRESGRVGSRGSGRGEREVKCHPHCKSN